VPSRHGDVVAKRGLVTGTDGFETMW